MRILHVGKYYYPVPGGMETFLRDLLSALSRKGIEVRAIVHHRKSGMASNFEDVEGIPVVRAEILGHFGFVPVSIEFPWILLEHIKSFKPDILHFHLPNASAFWALVMPPARKIPWVVHWHSDVIRSNFNRTLETLYPLYAFPEKLFLKQAATIIATSPDYLYSSPTLRHFLSKCITLPLGTDVERISMLSKKDNTPLEDLTDKGHGTARFRLLSVGRLTYYKGFDFLIKVLAKLPDDTVLHIAGSGSLEKSLKNLAKEMGVEDRVCFYGYLPDEYLHALFRSSDCFVLGSIERTEAFGIVLLEAMCHGKPVIVSNIKGSGVRWIIREARCGLLFEPGDIDDCVTKILWMKNHPEETRQYGTSGQSYLKKHLLIDHVSEKIIDVYRSLI